MCKKCDDAESRRTNPVYSRTNVPGVDMSKVINSRPHVVKENSDQAESREVDEIYGGKLPGVKELVFRAFGEKESTKWVRKSALEAITKERDAFTELSAKFGVERDALAKERDEYRAANDVYERINKELQKERDNLRAALEIACRRGGELLAEHSAYGKNLAENVELRQKYELANKEIEIQVGNVAYWRNKYRDLLKKYEALRIKHVEAIQKLRSLVNAM